MLAPALLINLVVVTVVVTVIALGGIIFWNSGGKPNKSHKPNNPNYHNNPSNNPSKKNIYDCLPKFSCNPADKYRTLDGSCNNLENPGLGVTNTPVTRLLPASYSDGKSEIRLSKNGQPLPNVRFIRATLLPDGDNPDPQLTLGVMSWGQMVTHDVALRALSEGGPKSCCNADGSFNPDPQCNPIAIPPNDYFYSKFNQLCMDVKRVRTTNDIGCNITPIRQISGVSHFLDASLIYGSSKELSDNLRLFQGGLLKTRTSDDGRPFLTNVPKPSQACDVPKDTDVCYLAGDPERVNANTEIAAGTVMLLRLHNKLAAFLQQIHSSWSDEILFQEARRIVIAIMQHITYNEYLPLVLGSQYVENNNLVPQKSGYAKGYNPKTNPSTISEFTSTAFRSLHSGITGSPQLISEDRSVRSSVQLSDLTARIGIIETSDNFDHFLRGLISQSQKNYDPHFTAQFANSFGGSKDKPIAERNGVDIISIDLTRGREYGVPPYTKMRTLCGLPSVNKFEDLNDVMDADKISLLSQVYSSVHDIDYYVGGLLEKRLPGALSTPSFHCVIAKAFHRYKFGDRFFYEFEDHPGKFTPEQLDSIRTFTYSMLICMTGDHIQQAQPMGFRKIDPQSNPLKSCSEIMAAFELDPWA